MARITFICPTRTRFTLADRGRGTIGGIETATIELALGLARRGHRVVVATRRDPGTDEADGVRNVPLGDAARQPADLVVSSNDPRPLGEAPAAARRVLWLHNPLALEKAARRSWLGPIVRLRPDAVLVGTTAAAALSRLYPFASRRVIPHGVSQAFRARPPSDGSARHFVFASQRQRGLDRTIRAWRAHDALRALRAQLHVFGTSAAQAELDEAAAARDGIVFHPRADQAALAAFYATARAMLYPGAHDETFCLAAAEAQAMGLPLITLGIGSLAERVRHGIDGFLAGSDREAAELAALVARDDDLWRLLSAGALLQREALTWDRAAALWEAFFLAPA
jgi:glycosyltransferase involved in cell wall biosynthesis